MGLGALVRCNCWEEGRTSEPPVPREWVCVDEHDRLYIGYGRCSEEEEEQFEEWMQTACEHPWMCSARENIAAYHWCTRFREVLKRAGQGRFDLLSDAIGGISGDLTDPGTAGQALAELDEFRSLERPLQEPSLVDAATGERIGDGLNILTRLFVVAPCNLATGFVKGKFVVRETRSRKILFRSRRFRQKTSRRGHRAGVELVDVATGTRLNFPVPWGRKRTGR
jgi:hypothetical protein